MTMGGYARTLLQSVKGQSTVVNGGVVKQRPRYIDRIATSPKDLPTPTRSRDLPNSFKRNVRNREREFLPVAAETYIALLWTQPPVALRVA